MQKHSCGKGDDDAAKMKQIRGPLVQTNVKNQTGDATKSKELSGKAGGALNGKKEGNKGER